MRVEEVKKLNEASSHYDIKGYEVQPCQCFGQPFVVTCQPPETGNPGEIAPYHLGRY
jgi:hypothetical protein